MVARLSKQGNCMGYLLVVCASMHELLSKQGHYLGYHLGVCGSMHALLSKQAHYLWSVIPGRRYIQIRHSKWDNNLGSVRTCRRYLFNSTIKSYHKLRSLFE